MRYFLNLILFLIVICVGNESLANPPIVLNGAVRVDQETAIRDITASNIAMRSLRFEIGNQSFRDLSREAYEIVKRAMPSDVHGGELNSRYRSIMREVQEAAINSFTRNYYLNNSSTTMALDSRELRLQGIAPAPVIHYRITANNRMTIDRLIFHTNGVNEIAINQSRLFLRTLIEKGSITLDGDRVIPLKHIRIGNPTVESLAKKYSSLVNRNSNPEQYLASPLAEAILERTQFLSPLDQGYNGRHLDFPIDQRYIDSMLKSLIAHRFEQLAHLENDDVKRAERHRQSAAAFHQRAQNHFLNPTLQAANVRANTRLRLARDGFPDARTSESVAQQRLRERLLFQHGDHESAVRFYSPHIIHYTPDFVGAWEYWRETGRSPSSIGDFEISANSSLRELKDWALAVNMDQVFAEDSPILEKLMSQTPLAATP